MDGEAVREPGVITRSTAFASWVVLALAQAFAGSCATRPAKPNLPPEISITAPTPASRWYRGHAASVRVEAMDRDGFVRSVAVFINGHEAVVMENAPYLWRIVPSSTGEMTITAIATDDQGSTSNSATSVHVNECSVDACDEELSVEDALCCGPLPTVRWLSPMSRQRFVSPTDVPLEVSASVAEGAIRGVEFSVNGTVVGRVDRAPFRFVWKGVAPGSYDLQAMVTTNLAGVRIASNHVTVERR